MADALVVISRDFTGGGSSVQVLDSCMCAAEIGVGDVVVINGVMAG